MVLLLDVFLQQLLDIIDFLIKLFDFPLKTLSVDFLVLVSNGHELLVKGGKIFPNCLNLQHVEFLMFNDIVFAVDDPFFELGYRFLRIIELFHFLILVNVVGMVRKM